MTSDVMQQISTLATVLIAIAIPTGLIGFTFLMLQPARKS